MNLPNRLTIIRALLVPVFLLFLLVPAIPMHYLWAAVIFSIASITDWLDGHLARKNDNVTNFGKFLDPLADKVLVTGAIIAFVALDLAGPVPVILIVARDFLVSGIRLSAMSSGGKVIAANWWGKVKTALQMSVITAVMLFCHMFENNAAAFQAVARISRAAMWVIALFTVVSGLVYLVQNRNLIDTDK